MSRIFTAISFHCPTQEALLIKRLKRLTLLSDLLCIQLSQGLQ